MRLPSLAVLFATLAVSGLAAAQPIGEGFALQQYDPSWAGDRFFAAPDAEVDGHLRPAVKLTFDYAWKPLWLYDTQTGAPVANGILVRNQFYLHVDASLALFHRLEIGVGLPFALYQNGQSPLPNAKTVGGDLSDFRVGARVNLFTDEHHRFSLGLQADLWLPVGSQSNYTGDGITRGHPRIVAGGLFAERFVWSLAVGAMIRAHKNLGIAEIGSALTYSGALGMLLLDKHLQVGPELFGSTMFKNGSTPLEIMLGAHYCIHDFTIGLGGGAGLTRAPGAAAARAMLNVAWQPNACGPPDRDGDGIPDAEDACPDVPGVKNADPAKNGCPPDRDGDGIADAEDACPDVPGVKSADPKKNGCPPDRDGDGIADVDDACPDVPGVKNADPRKNGCPPDRDGDGIPDAVDACPDEPGVKSADPKKNGCPSDRDGDGIPDKFDACPDVAGPPNKDPAKNGCPPDRDNDGIPDAVDACPDVPGVKSDNPKKNGCPSDRDDDGIPDSVDACPDLAGLPNKDPKKNGCPPDRDGDGVYDFEDACPDKPGPRSEDPKKNGCPAIAVLAKGSIVILQQVQFDYGKATIKAASDGLLKEVSGILRDHPEIVALAVEGHTDDRGSAAQNKILSQKRSEAVRDWLVTKGKIDPRRLTAHGFGPDRPLDPAKTEAARTKNRRVEFRIAPKNEELEEIKPLQ